MIDVADSNTVYYYHFDGLGSVIALSDVNSVIVERYSYDVFGKPSNTSDVNNPYLFTGRRYDDETGLYYYRARYYDYATGRFMQTDPVGYTAGLNLYAYCGNNPGNFVDPLGLQSNIVTRAYNIYDQTTSAEIWWILTEPVTDVGIVRAGRGEAISAVIEEYGVHQDDTISNAYLHAYWSAYITEEGGILLAKTYTDLHEANRGQTFEYGSGGLMDLYNNLIGRALASSAFTEGWSISEMLEYALQNNLLATHRLDPKLKKFNPKDWFDFDKDDDECK